MMPTLIESLAILVIGGLIFYELYLWLEDGE